MLSCKGSIRDIVVIVIVTIAMLAVLHQFLSFRSSQQDTTHSKMAIASVRSVNPPLSIARTPFLSSQQVAAVSTPTPTAFPTLLPTTSPPRSQIPQLVSLYKPVTADVRGNLGPPEVVTNEAVADWLKDRWQGT